MADKIHCWRVWASYDTYSRNDCDLRDTIYRLRSLARAHARRLGPSAPQRDPHSGLRLRQRVVAFENRLDDRPRRVAGVLLGLEPGGEFAADDPAGLLGEYAGHLLAVEGEGAKKPPVFGYQPVQTGGPVEADVGEGLERARHLPRHVHLENERLRGQPVGNSGIERQLDGRAQVGPDRLLDEQVEAGLLDGAETHGAAGQGAAGQGQGEQAGLGGPAGVLLDGHVAEEAAAVEETGAGRLIQHPGRQTQ